MRARERRGQGRTEAFHRRPFRKEKYGRTSELRGALKKKKSGKIKKNSGCGWSKKRGDPYSGETHPTVHLIG